MLPLPDLGIIVLIALACALVVGALGLLVLRLVGHASMLVQLTVVVVTATVSVAVGMIAVGNAMYVSSHDLLVSIWVAGASALVTLGVAIVLGRTFSRNTRRLRSIVRALGDGEEVAAESGRGDSTEFASVEAELALTSRRLAETRDELASMDASRRQLVAWISHDLRTPLAGLRAMAEALEDGLAEDPQRFHRQMRSQVDQLSAMVDDLFELSKIQSGTLALALEPVSLYDLVSDSVAELADLARARSITLTESAGDGDLTVMGDQRELGRVIRNLLMNAIQHSPQGGEISIASRRGPDGDVVLTVQDSGGGIPEQDLSKIFQAGWRATPSRTPESVWGPAAGAGLGLAIVRGIVEAHSGGVSVSNVQGGARFDVRLPQPQAAPA